MINSAAARPLSSAHAEWLEGRNLDVETAAAMGLYSARRDPRGDEEDGWHEPIPDAKGKILVFPFFDANGNEFNAKYRGPQKRLWQRPKSRKGFYNEAVLDDRELTTGRQALVIVEGELDCIAAIQAGHPWTVSCPDGAPADVDAAGRPIPMKPDSEIDPAHDPKYEYIANNWEKLAKIKRIVLATDGDGPGQRLRDELARRLGRVRCLFAEFPGEWVVPQPGQFPNARACKDPNEVIQFIGPAALLETLQRAKPYPVSGLYTIDDFEDRGDLTTFEVGISPETDHLFRLYRGAFVVASGLPQHGKSLFVDQVAVYMAQRYGWRTGFGSFEEPVRPQLYNKLANMIVQRRRENWTVDDREHAMSFVRKHFCFITDAPKKGGDTDRQSVEWLRDRAADAVIRHGIDLLIVDPWNELDHIRMPGEMRDEYAARAIKMLKRFASDFDCVVIVVVHPTKEAGNRVREHPEESMSIYDAADGAMWFNKAELAFIITRQTEPNGVGRGTSKFSMRKVKFPETGRLGECGLVYDNHTRMFVDDDTPLQEAMNV